MSLTNKTNQTNSRMNLYNHLDDTYDTKQSQSPLPRRKVVSSRTIRRKRNKKDPQSRAKTTRTKVKMGSNIQDNVNTAIIELRRAKNLKCTTMAAQVCKFGKRCRDPKNCRFGHIRSKIKEARNKFLAWKRKQVSYKHFRCIY